MEAFQLRRLTVSEVPWVVGKKPLRQPSFSVFTLQEVQESIDSEKEFYLCIGFYSDWST